MDKQKTINDFPYVTNDKVRYNDTDRQGHVNNAVFAEYIETGRVELLYHPEHPLYKDGCSFVIVKSNIDLVSEVYWPGTVELGTMVSRIGNSSIGFSQMLFQDERVVATAETVIVQVNNETKKSEPLSASTIETLKKYMV